MFTASTVITTWNMKKTTFDVLLSILHYIYKIFTENVQWKQRIWMQQKPLDMTTEKASS